MLTVGVFIYDKTIWELFFQSNEQTVILQENNEQGKAT